MSTEKRAGGDACGPRRKHLPTGATHCDSTGTSALRGEKLLHPLCLVNACAHPATGQSKKENREIARVADLPA